VAITVDSSIPCSPRRKRVPLRRHNYKAAVRFGDVPCGHSHRTSINSDKKSHIRTSKFPGVLLFYSKLWPRITEDDHGRHAHE